MVKSFEISKRDWPWRQMYWPMVASLTTATILFFWQTNEGFYDQFLGALYLAGFAFILFKILYGFLNRHQKTRKFTDKPHWKRQYWIISLVIITFVLITNLQGLQSEQDNTWIGMSILGLMMLGISLVPYGILSRRQKKAHAVTRTRGVLQQWMDVTDEPLTNAEQFEDEEGALPEIQAPAENSELQVVEDQRVSTDTQERDFQTLQKRIVAFEKLCDLGKATPQVISRYQNQLSAMADKYLHDEDAGSGRFMLLEMQALINTVDGSGDSVDPLLVKARALMAPGEAFVSAGGRKWLDDKQMDEAALVRQSRAKIKSRRPRWLWLLGGALLLVFAYQPMADQLTLWTADPAMISLAHQADMTRQGELLFLDTHPQLDTDSQMESDCGQNASAINGDGFIEQGCYDPQSNRIYIRKMPSDLSDMEVATAAYEMLHVVYMNDVNAGEGTALNQSIEANYSQLKDANLDQQVANFAKTEPNSRDLELFSLLATGYSNVSSDLSAYYSAYFNETDTIVSDNNSVYQTFQTDEDQLSQYQAAINTDNANANTAYNDSVGWADQGNQYEDDYNYNVYTEDLNNANNTIDQYNNLLNQYNELVTEYDGTQPVAQIQTDQSSAEN